MRPRRLLPSRYRFARPLATAAGLALTLAALASATNARVVGAPRQGSSPSR